MDPNRDKENYERLNRAFELAVKIIVRKGKCVRCNLKMKCMGNIVPACADTARRQLMNNAETGRKGFKDEKANTDNTH